MRAVLKQLRISASNADGVMESFPNWPMAMATKGFSPGRNTSALVKQHKIV